MILIITDTINHRKIIDKKDLVTDIILPTL